MNVLQLPRNILSREIILERTTTTAIGLFSFIVLTALGAYVRIPLPFTPVPVTLQTFFVLLAGAVLGKRWGMFSQLGYVFLGSIGLPIFAGASFGLTALCGPTGGYLFGFVLVGWLVGRTLTQENREVKFSRIIIVMLCASLSIDLLGCIWLKVFFRLGWRKIFILGLWPFLIGDITKSIVAAIVYKRIQRRTRQIFLTG